jgi:hypothetical protein
MTKRIFKVFTIIGLFLLASCADDDEGVEYFFDREILDMSVLRECAPGVEDESYCYQLRFRYPIETKELKGIHLWLDTTVIDDTSKAVSSAALEKSILIEYNDKKADDFDTIDLTALLADYLDRDSLQVALWPEYTDKDKDEKKGSLQRLHIHFGDDSPPSRVNLQDSVWSTGALFDWARPTDQIDFYDPNNISGPIVGYNIVIYAENKEEDLRNLKIKVLQNTKVDSTGSSLYNKHARIRAIKDSIWVDETSQSDNVKNYMRIAVLDGKGFDFDLVDANRFRLIIEGLQPESRYTIGITAYDSSGNDSGNDGSETVENNQLFITTDKIAPLMPEMIFTVRDTLNSSFTRLDSNNRVLIYWSNSVDPVEESHNISVDSVLKIPSSCSEYFCYRAVSKYIIERYNGNSWDLLAYAGGEASTRYTKKYEWKGDSMAVSAIGKFVSDTIRWVLPMDTLILRIRSVDSSGYYSKALIDTLYIAPHQVADLECPPGFVAVESSDTTRFCMESIEHRDENGEFYSNVLHSEAMEICNAMSLPGFNVSLCHESDWQKACLSGGSSTYGVIEDGDVASSEYLFSYCNVGTNDSLFAKSFVNRNAKCANRFGIRDLPGQYQEWVLGRSSDTLQVLKGSSFQQFEGLDRETAAMCTNRFFPYYTRMGYTQDTIYLYVNGTTVDTTLTADTTKTLYAILTQKDFKDTLQFFDVKNPETLEVIGEDYALLSEYKKGDSLWLENLAQGLIYEPSRKEVVFLLKPTSYRAAAAFYKDNSISFRCCAYPE